MFRILIFAAGILSCAVGFYANAEGENCSETALSILEDVDRLFPGRTPENGEFVELAIQRVESALLDSPKCKDAIFRAGVIQQRVGNYAESSRYATTGLNLYPDDYNFTLMKAFACPSIESDCEPILQELDRVVEQRYLDAGSHFYFKAVILDDMGEVDRAFPLLSKSIEMRPILANEFNARHEGIFMNLKKEERFWTLVESAHPSL